MAYRGGRGRGRGGFGGRFGGQPYAKQEPFVLFPEVTRSIKYQLFHSISLSQSKAWGVYNNFIFLSETKK